MYIPASSSKWAKSSAFANNDAISVKKMIYVRIIYLKHDKIINKNILNIEI